MSGRVTIKDVAKEANVSIKTVSNVLNHTGSMRPETRERVEAAIKRLGYTLNVAARAMKVGGTRLIGLNIFDFSQPFAPYLADCVIASAKRREYGVIINTYGMSVNGLPESIADTYRLGADGWIFFTGMPLAQEGQLLHQPYPLVLAGDYLSYGKSDMVTMPNIDSVCATVGKLLDSGVDDIALIGMRTDERDWRTLATATEGTDVLRAQGYVKAFEMRGKQWNPQRLLTMDQWTHTGGSQAVDKLLDGGKHPQAILCMNDALALGAITQLQRRGLRVPQDVQVIGYDNVPETKYAMPGLTTMDPHVEQYADRAVQMVIERIEGYDGPARTFVTPYDLVERDSTML